MAAPSRDAFTNNDGALEIHGIPFPQYDVRVWGEDHDPRLKECYRTATCKGCGWETTWVVTMPDEWGNARKALVFHADRCDPRVDYHG